MAMSVAFLTATSLMAMVPLSEFSTPTLIPVAVVAAVVAAGAVLAAAAAVGLGAGACTPQAASNPAAEAASAAPVDALKKWRLVTFWFNIAQPYPAAIWRASALLPGH